MTTAAPSNLSKTSKMLAFLNYRMRITMADNRTLVGTFRACPPRARPLTAPPLQWRSTST
jgi:hypothetical protein